MANFGETSRLKCTNFEAWITVDGKELERYGVESKEREATCWIVSETDKEFSVHFRKLAYAGCDCAVDVFVDGIPVHATLIRNAYGNQAVHVNFARVSMTEGKKFIFGALELTDDDAHLPNMTSCEAIGEIKVTFTRASILRKGGSGEKNVTIPEEQKVHERSKKALAHRVKFSKTSIQPLTADTYFASRHEILETIIFRYRPLAMLQANGIVPYAPPATQQEASRSPSPLLLLPTKRKEIDVKPEIDDEDDAEDPADVVVARRKVLRAELEKIEEELASRKGTGRPKKKVKTEIVSPFIPGEIIDLTI